MLRAVALASILALTAGAALAQPPGDPALSPAPGDPSTYGAQQPAQPGYPPGGPQGPGGSGYGAQGYGQGGYGQGAHTPPDPETRALRQRMRAACATDVSTYCTSTGQAGGEQGQGDRRALHQCMMANQAKFTLPCQQAMADLHEHTRQVRMGGGAQPAMGSPPSLDGPGGMPPTQPPPQ